MKYRAHRVIGARNQLSFCIARLLREPSSADIQGVGDGCVAFITPEGELNATQLALRVRSDVPEPASLGLVGIGLLALIGWRRRVTDKQG